MTTEQETSTHEHHITLEVTDITILKDKFIEFLDLYGLESEKVNTYRLEESARLEQEKLELEAFRNDLLIKLDEMQAISVNTNEVINLMYDPDYTSGQTDLLANQFDGTNVLIGCVLGVAVAIAFIKGFGQ